MDSSQSNAQGFFGIMTRGGRRTQVVVIAALVIVGLLVWNQLPGTPQTCRLIEGCKLRSNDLHRIQIALGKAGLNDFEVEESNVLVPRNQRDLYLQAVSDGGALPDGISLNKEKQASVNPLLSRTQQEQLRQEEKKNQVREMVMRLDFVDQAWFEMDRVKSRNSFQRDEQTAVIVIQPIEKLRLEFDQIETIRGTISGAIAGIDRERIVVTDLNAGVAYEDRIPTDSTKPSPENSLAFSHDSINRKHRYENEIRLALEDMQGIELTVEVQQETVQVPDSQPMLNVRQNKPNVITVGTNGQAAVANTVATPIPMIKTKVEKVRVRIGVPEQLLLADAEISGSTLSELRQAAQYRSKLQEVKNEIIAKVSPILPSSSFNEFEAFPISVSVMEQPTDVLAESSEPWYAEAMDRVGGPGGAIAVLMLAGMIIAFVFSGSRQSGEPEPAVATIPFSREPEGESENPAEHSIKQEISKLIEEDPEAAAQVIKRWIRNAA